MRKEASNMKSVLFNVQNDLCGECSLALRRFVGGLDGVESIDVEQGKVAVRFDETAMDEDTLTKLTRESIEKLGYRIEE